MKLIITRHPALIQFLKEEYNISGEVVTHATPEMVKGRDVIGVLPHSLSCLCNSFSEVPLKFTLEMREQKQELTVKQIRAIAQPLKTYIIKRIEHEK